jgi:ABC-type branched-subunit amino acid transport system ATPase component/branched-subunit amino acid ABC-type transport system permease component
MTEVMRFLLLGLGSGSIFAIAGIGLTQIYRGSGTLNLAHGAIAYLSATLFVQAWVAWDWPMVAAAAAAVATSAMVGLVIQRFVMHPLREAAPLVRMASTLGVLAIIQQGVPLVFGSDPVGSIGTFYPSGRLSLTDDLSVPQDRLVLLAITLAIGASLWAMMSRTRFGLATQAAAENSLVAASMRVAPERVALANWVIGATLAGLAGVLIVPIVGSITPTPFLLLVIPALAASMVGRFSSFAWTVAGGLAIGAMQSVATRYQGDLLPDHLAIGWSEALPLLVIVALLARRGSVFPLRGEIATQLPRVGRRRVKLIWALIALVAAVGLGLQANRNLADALMSSSQLAIVGLSLVVIVGLGGQTSLAQLSLAGVGALVAVRFGGDLNFPFPLALLVGVVGGSLVGALFGLLALRTRGPTLAVATLGLGAAIDAMVFSNRWITGGNFSGSPVPRPTLFGVEVDAFNHPNRFAAVSLALLVIVCVAVANLRASAVGRQLLAVRGNERAAASLAISVRSTKLRAFILSAGIASLGGVLTAYRFDTVTYGPFFGVLPSLNLVVFSLIGGIGYVLGPVIGAAIAPAGLVSWLVEDSDNVQRWLTVLGGLGLIVTLIKYPHGIAGAMSRHRRGRAEGDFDTEVHEADVRVPPKRLEVRGLSVAFGGINVLHDVEFCVEPGEIVGLIGPNGAGKTTTIDAISGFARTHTGRILLGGEDLSDRPTHERSSAGISRSFQTVEIFDDMTVGENLAVAAERVRLRDWATSLVGHRNAQLDAAVLHIARVFRIDDLEQPSSELTSAQRRLLGVARALATAPSVLLLDEPVAGLDAEEAAAFSALLREVASEWGVGMLLVEHDVDFVARTCDRVVVMDFGVVLCDGPPEEVLKSSLTRAAYLGDLSDAVEVPDQTDIRRVDELAHQVAE